MQNHPTSSYSYLSLFGLLRTMYRSLSYHQQQSIVRKYFAQYFLRWYTTADHKLMFSFNKFNQKWNWTLVWFFFTNNQWDWVQLYGKKLERNLFDLFCGAEVKSPFFPPGWLGGGSWDDSEHGIRPALPYFRQQPVPLLRYYTNILWINILDFNKSSRATIL